MTTIKTFNEHWILCDISNEFRVLNNFREEAIKRIKQLQRGCGDEPNQCGWNNTKQDGSNLCGTCLTGIDEIKYLFDIVDSDLNED
jgi:hypothetical protein